MLSAIALLLQLQSGPPADPRSVLLDAARAIEGSSMTAVARAWADRVRRDSTDWAARLGLATLARLSYDHAAADARYRSLTRVTAPAADPYVAAAYLEWGREHQTRGANAPADSSYRTAAEVARRAGHRGLEASALIALGSLRARTAGPPTGDPFLKQAGALLPASDLLGQSELHCARAALLQMTGGVGVETEARAGADFAAQAGSSRQRAHCQRFLALSVMDRDRDSGLALLREVVDTLTRVRDHAALASVLQWRGYRRFTSYEYGLARSDLLRAVEEGNVSGALSPVAWALLNLAQVSGLSGDLVAARQYGDSAEVLFRAQNDQWGLGALTSLQAEVAYVAGDLAAARRSYGQALAAAEATGYPLPIIWYQTAHAVLAMDEGDLAEAAHRLARAEAVARASHMSEDERGLTYHQARLALLRGRADSAVLLLRRFLPGLDASQPAAAYRWRARLAEALMRLGRAGEAEHELRRASDALDSARAGLDDRALRTAVLQSLRDLRDPHLGIPQVLAGLVNAGRTEAAFELAERRKARSLLDRLVLHAAFSEREGKAVPVTTAARQPSPVLGASQIAGALPDDRTALLEFVTGADRAPTTLFVVSRSGIRASKLPPFDSLAGDVRRFLALVESGEHPSELGRTLGDALLGPAVEQLPASVDHLVVVPDAGLQRLPFDALTLPDGRLVAERFVVSSAPSAAVAARLWRLPRHTAPVNLLALGDPRFPGEVASGTEADVYRDAFRANGGLTRLAASAGEARAVAGLAPVSELRLRDAASESYLKTAPLRRFRVVHVAAHALVDELGPTRTALALAPGGGEDGFVTAGDLAALDLDADLVVLSACRTAGGVFVHSEGVEGLTAPLLEVGARSVMASLWRVGDRSTADFVIRFYRELAAGGTTGGALAAAKRDAIRRGVPPAVWAAFTLLGDETVQIPLRPPARPVWPGVALGAAALAAGYWWLIRRRRKVERT